MNLTRVDLLMLILYTSPMFEMCTSVIRAMGIGNGNIQFGPLKTEDRPALDNVSVRLNPPPPPPLSPPPPPPPPPPKKEEEENPRQMP